MDAVRQEEVKLWVGGKGLNRCAGIGLIISYNQSLDQTTSPYIRRLVLSLLCLFLIINSGVLLSIYGFSKINELQQLSFIML